MDVMQIANLSTSMSQMRLMESVNISMLKNAMEMQESIVTQLTDMVADVPMHPDSVSVDITI